jgi:hypothetical protein
MSKNVYISMGEEMDKQSLVAPCGIACFECNVYKAKENDEYKKRISMATGIDESKCVCGGCRSKNGKVFLVGKNNVFPTGKSVLKDEDDICNIYKCTNKRGIHNCSECNNFPCDKLQPYSDKAKLIPHNLKVFNLCQIRKLGLEKWINEKASITYRKYASDKMDIDD